MTETILWNSSLIPVAQSDRCAVFQMKNDTGEGTMTMYDVFPGVMLAYNDYHMEHCESVFQTQQELFCIDHCREGRLEYAANESAYSYVEAGDLKMDCRLEHTGHFTFPLSHYHGITVSFTLPEAARRLKEQIQDFPVDLYALREKFCNGGHPMVIHGAPSIEHVFGELYAVPEKIKLQYFKIKVLELLLYLEAIELPQQREERPYFYKSQVEKIKAIQRQMTEHLEHHYTLEELSEQFDIPLTPMKSCFKNVYGSPVNTYMRAYRMNRAASLLRRERERSVAEIAGLVGYDSPSKFAAAFKAVIGQAPLEYRKNG